MSTIGTRRALFSGGFRPVVFENFLAEAALSGNLSFSRPSPATMFNASGVLVTAGTNVPRFDHDSSGNPLGLLIEGPSTNYIPNNSGTGAVIGGAIPDNWNIRVSGPGLSWSVVGIGTENGIPYIDLQIFGTTSGVQGFNVDFNYLAQPAASLGQTWTASLYLKLVGGSLSNISSIQIYTEEDSNSGYLQGHYSPSITPTNASLISQRTQYVFQIANASTTQIFMSLWPQIASGQVINCTLRIGGLQLEPSAFATSLIPTTSGAAARAADLAQFVNEPNGQIIVEWTDESTGVTSRSLFASSAFGPALMVNMRYRQIAAYAPGIPMSHLDTKLAVGGPF